LSYVPAKYHDLLTVRIFEMKPVSGAAGVYGQGNGPVGSLPEFSADRIRPLLCPCHCSCLPEDSTGLCVMTFTSSLKIFAARFYLYKPHIIVKYILIKLYYESNIGKTFLKINFK
jgi:hypothetical protein